MHGCHVREEPLVAMNLMNRPSLLCKNTKQMHTWGPPPDASSPIHLGLFTGRFGPNLLKTVIRTD